MTALPGWRALLAARMRSASTLVRWLLFALMVVLFFRHEDLARQTFEPLRAANPAALLLALALYVAGQLMAGHRVRLLVEAVGHDVPYRTLLADFMRSVGLSITLAMGAGDVYRIARLGAEGLDLVRASSVLVIDRGLGMLGVGITGLLGLLFFGGERIGFSSAGLAGLAAIAALLVFALAFGRRIAERWFPNTLELLDRFVGEPRRVASLLGSSLVILALWIASVVVLGAALALPVSAGALAAAASLVTLATLVPISIGGVGLREAGYVLLLGPFGVAASDAIALGLAQYGCMVVTAAAAWLLFPSGRLSIDRSGERAPAA